MQVGTGRSILNGIAIGKLKIYKKKDTVISTAEIADTAAEVARFEAAQQKAIEQQTALYEKALAEAGEDIAEVFNISQRSIPARLAIAVPIFVIGVILANVDFNIIWRYFGFANQALAAIMLWAAAAYLYRKHRLHWVCTVPATFMTSVCMSYICYEPNMGLGMPIAYADAVGIASAVVALVAFLVLARKPIEGAPDIDTV